MVGDDDHHGHGHGHGYGIFQVVGDTAHPSFGFVADHHTWTFDLSQVARLVMPIVLFALIIS